MGRIPGWGTWIRTKIDGVRVRCSTVELSPTRWKAVACGWAKMTIGLSDIDEHAAQLRAGIAIINAAIEGKIKLVGTPCARWQTEAHLLRLTGHRIAIGSLIPFERSLSPFVDEAYGQNAEKVHHRSEAESPDLAEGHGPGKQKRDLEIENDEKQRHQIEAHVESHARVIEGIKSAFIGGKFFSGSGALNATRKGATSKAPEITAATAMKTASGRYWWRRLGMNELGLK